MLARRKSLIACLCATVIVVAGISMPAFPSRSLWGPAVARAQAPAKKIRIGVSVPAADHGWTAGIGWWAKRAMALHPEIDWQYATAPKPEKQIADIGDM